MPSAVCSTASSALGECLHRGLAPVRGTQALRRLHGAPHGKAAAAARQGDPADEREMGPLILRSTANPSRAMCSWACPRRLAAHRRPPPRGRAVRARLLLPPDHPRRRDQQRPDLHQRDLRPRARGHALRRRKGALAERWQRHWRGIWTRLQGRLAYRPRSCRPAPCRSTPTSSSPSHPSAAGATGGWARRAAQNKSSTWSKRACTGASTNLLWPGQIKERP